MAIVDASNRRVAVVRSANRQEKEALHSVSDRKRAQVNNTASNSLQRQGAEVGQTDATERFVQLQAVKETSAAAPPYRRQHGDCRRSPDVTTPFATHEGVSLAVNVTAICGYLAFDKVAAADQNS